MHGYEVCRALKTDPQTVAIHVVMLTARAGPADQRLAAEAGADAYLTKPFSPAELLTTVQLLLQTEQTEMERQQLPPALAPTASSSPAPSKPI
jgi:CheY-like chemotaxis protein